MLNFVITPLTAVTLGAAALGPAGAAAAFPNAETAADVVDNLTAEGYNVQVNGLVQVPLKLCNVTDVHPRPDDAATLQEKQQTQVFVDVSCRSHD
jgi:hypothetical protein